MPYSRRNSKGATRFTRKSSTYRGRAQRRSPSTAMALKANPFSQKKQTAAIIRNAAMVQKLLADEKRSRVYTDWVMGLWASAPVTNTWKCSALIDPVNWSPTMRQGWSVSSEKSTYVRNIKVQFEAKLLSANSAKYYNVFIVKPRRRESQRDFHIEPPQNGTDYVSNPSNLLEQITLNQGVFKVIGKKQFRLMSNTWGQPQQFHAPDGSHIDAGSPALTTMNCEFNIQVKAKIGASDARAWQQLGSSDIPFYDQYWIMVMAISADGEVDQALSCSAYTIATCINSD